MGACFNYGVEICWELSFVCFLFFFCKSKNINLFLKQSKNINIQQKIKIKLGYRRCLFSLVSPNYGGDVPPFFQGGFPLSQAAADDHASAVMKDFVFLIINAYTSVLVRLGKKNWKKYPSYDAMLNYLILFTCSYVRS